GKRAPKVVLCDDPRIRPGLPCRVRVSAIRKPQRSDRGAIEVEFLESQAFQIEGVYLDPVVSRKLQILLQSGLTQTTRASPQRFRMNILLEGPPGGPGLNAGPRPRCWGFSTRNSGWAASDLAREPGRLSAGRSAPRQSPGPSTSKLITSRDGSPM